MVLPDRYIDHGAPHDQLEEAGPSSRQISATVLSLLGRPKEALQFNPEVRNATAMKRPGFQRPPIKKPNAYPGNQLASFDFCLEILLVFNCKALVSFQSYWM